VYEDDVRILRDSWGVPHSFGVSDADAAFSLAYAQAEDDFATIQDQILTVRARMASAYGGKAAPIDYIVQLLRVREFVDAKYDTDLSPKVRAVLEAAAAGMNYYAELHPEEVKPAVHRLLPATGKDIVVGFVLTGNRRCGLDDAFEELFGPERKREISKKSITHTSQTSPLRNSPVGSNAFAVAPSRSADGKTRLACNSHQPWTGPESWYEAHVHSEEGWDMVGGLFPGMPFLANGHNRNLGWAHTNNYPDMVDVYVLDINPDNSNQYRFDGEWRDFEVGTARIKVKLFGPISWTFKRETLWSVHGPVVRRPHGTYAVRFPGIGEIRFVEQVYRQNKARNFEEWLDAMRMPMPARTNHTYADREGNIYYIYYALLPMRAEGYDWTQYLPGDTSETLWMEYLPFDKLPQVKNPASGFVQNCNSSPFQTTIGPENPKAEDYSKTLGIETRMTNRALRAVELYGGDGSITEEEFYKYKYDMTYSEKSEIAKFVREILASPLPDDPLAREALEVLRAWDLRTNPENTNAALGVLTVEPILRAPWSGTEPPDLMTNFLNAAQELKKAYGRLDVRWSEVNRLVRGELDLGVGGGPDILHAIWGGEVENGRISRSGGDGYVLIVTWDKDGEVSSRSIHQYGSATIDESSPHYADQAHLFVKRLMKPVWFNEADIRANLGREYRPGEETTQ
jgi:penicillin amidase/acyl-homoserine-lactone acylase